MISNGDHHIDTNDIGSMLEWLSKVKGVISVRLAGIDPITWKLTLIVSNKGDRQELPFQHHDLKTVCRQAVVGVMQWRDAA